MPPRNTLFEMLNLVANKYRITIVNDPTYSDGSPDNSQKYGRAYRFGDETYQATSRHVVRITLDDEIIASCLLSSDGGTSGVHKNTAVIHNDCCVIAVGPFMASLKIPTLDLNWVTQTDDATCFGVYDSIEHNCIFSHGELLIARLTFGGTIIWQSGGADIFTGGFNLVGDKIRVVDFNDREYVFNAENGREIAA